MGPLRCAVLCTCAQLRVFGTGTSCLLLFGMIRSVELLAPPAAAAHRWQGRLPAVLHTVTLRVRARPSELVHGLLPQLCVQSVGPHGLLGALLFCWLPRCMPPHSDGVECCCCGGARHRRPKRCYYCCCFKLCSTVACLLVAGVLPVGQGLFMHRHVLRCSRLHGMGTAVAAVGSAGRCVVALSATHRQQRLLGSCAHTCWGCPASCRAAACVC